MLFILHQGLSLQNKLYFPQMFCIKNIRNHVRNLRKISATQRLESKNNFELISLFYHYFTVIRIFHSRSF